MLRSVAVAWSECEGEGERGREGVAMRMFLGIGVHNCSRKGVDSRRRSRGTREEEDEEEEEEEDIKRRQGVRNEEDPPQKKQKLVAIDI